MRQARHISYVSYVSCAILLERARYSLLRKVTECKPLPHPVSRRRRSRTETIAAADDPRSSTQGNQPRRQRKRLLHTRAVRAWNYHYIGALRGSVLFPAHHQSAFFCRELVIYSVQRISGLIAAVFISRRAARDRPILGFLVIVGWKPTRQHFRSGVLHDIRQHSRSAALRENIRAVSYQSQAVPKYQFIDFKTPQPALRRNSRDIHAAGLSDERTACCERASHKAAVDGDERKHTEPLRPKHQLHAYRITLVIQSGKAAALHRKIPVRRSKNHHRRRNSG